MPHSGSDVHSETHNHPLGTPPVFEEAAYEEQPRARGSSTPAVAAFFGFVCFAAGAALVAAPQLSWPLTKVARQLADQGLTGGALLGAGAAVFAIGMIARSLQRAEVGTDDSERLVSDVAQMTFVLEQVAGEIAWTKTQLAHVSACVESVTARTEEIALRPSGSDDQGPTSGQQNALFQLAASVDKLGAQFDKLLDDRIAALAAQIEGVRVALDGFDPASMPEASASHPPVPAVRSTPDLAVPDEIEMQVVVDLDVEGSLEDEPAMEFFDALDGIEDSLAGEASVGGSGALDLDRLELDTPAPPTPGGLGLDMKLPGDSVRESLEREHGSEPPLT